MERKTLFPAVKLKSGEVVVFFTGMSLLQALTVYWPSNRLKEIVGAGKAFPDGTGEFKPFVKRKTVIHLKALLKRLLKNPLDETYDQLQKNEFLIPPFVYLFTRTHFPELSRDAEEYRFVCGELPPQHFYSGLKGWSKSKIREVRTGGKVFEVAVSDTLLFYEKGENCISLHFQPIKV